MVVCFLRCSPVPTSHTIQVKLSLRMYEQTTRKQQHSSILLFSQKCEWPVARKSSVCCSSSLFILDDSYVVRWKYWIFSFAGVCRAAASDTAAAALLGASHCLCSSLPWLCRGCRRRKNWAALALLGLPAPLQQEQEGRDKQLQQTLHTGTLISAARARIRCLPQPLRFAEPGSSFASNIEHSWAWVCCMYISTSHSAGLLFPPWLVEKNTPRNLSGFACMCGFSRVCWPLECSCFVCYIACSNLCWAVLGRERKLWRNAWAFLFR